MKILQLGNTPYEEGGFNRTGGAATHAWQLSETLSKNGHDVYIFSHNFFHRKKTTKDGVMVIGPNPIYLAISIFTKKFRVKDIITIYRQYRTVSYRLVIGLVIYYILLSYILDKYNPDVVHAHHLEKRFFIANLLSEDDFRIVATSHSIHSITHSSGKLGQEYEKILKSSYENCDNLIFVSDELRDDYYNKFGEFEGNDRVIPNPIHFAHPSGISIDHNPNIANVLFVGSFTKRKGIKTFVRAMSKIESDTDITGWVVGDTNKAKVQKYISNIEGGESIRIPGRVQNIYEYYHIADIFVLPTEKESFGIVFIEAMSQGTPVIGTTGVPEKVIPNSDVGYRIKPNEPNILAEKIKEGLDKDWEKEKIRKHAQNFSWEESISDFEKFYRSSI